MPWFICGLTKSEDQDSSKFVSWARETEQPEKGIFWEDEITNLIKDWAPGVCKFVAIQYLIRAFLCILDSFSLHSWYMIFCYLIQWPLHHTRQMAFTTDVNFSWCICKTLFKGRWLNFCRFDFCVPRLCENWGLTKLDNLETNLPTLTVVHIFPVRMVFTSI